MIKGLTMPWLLLFGAGLTVAYLINRSLKKEPEYKYQVWTADGKPVGVYASEDEALEIARMLKNALVKRVEIRS